MKCAPIDTDASRFYVSTIEGYAIHATSGSGGALVLVATVIDGFYGSEHGRYSSSDFLKGGLPPPQRLGRRGALIAAEARCAELNAWHEREGWGEDGPLAS